jgi:hypothetical protein
VSHTYFYLFETKMSKIRPSITLDEVWEKLLNGIEHLFQYQTIRYSKWMLLYT